MHNCCSAPLVERGYNGVESPGLNSCAVAREESYKFIGLSKQPTHAVIKSLDLDVDCIQNITLVSRLTWRYFKATQLAVAQLAERWTVVVTRHPSVAGSIPAGEIVLDRWRPVRFMFGGDTGLEMVTFLFWLREEHEY